jgi:signal transduction histidine kinase/ActR/RegA family two-component response regulator/HAMP domain-containing protein
MNWLRDLPLRRKLTLVILLTCSGVLLLACGVLATFQIFNFRQNMVRDTTVLADVLAENTRAALAFQDDNAAQQTLRALESEPNVSAACLYSANGNQFATYTRAGATVVFPTQPAGDGHQFTPGHLVLFRPVILNQKRIGTLFVQADLQGVYDQLRLFGGMALLVLFGSLFVAFAISAPLQRPISRPILALAETARLIATQKDYKVRVPSQGRNETGLLTDAFNQLLGSIEERDTALSATNESLKTEISERRGVEQKLQDQLTRLALLHQITRATSERQDLQSIFQVVIRSVEDSLPIDFGCICLYEKDANVLLVTQVGVRSEAVAMDLAMTNQARVEIDQNVLSRCVSGKLVYESDLSRSDYPFPQRLARGGLCSFVAAPLMVESRVFGVLIAARRKTDGFSSGECEFLRQLSEHVGLAAHQAQLYEALQQAYDDLRQTQQAVMQQERLKALGQMASGIAHDINNAISPVALYTESLLEKEPNLSPRARDYLNTIQHAIEDVSHTVARMREFYRQREPQMNLTPVRLNQLLKQVIDLSRARWSDMPQQRGIFIRLETDFAAELPAILGVESELREALVNLIFNAVDAMPEGGTLTLRTRFATATSPLVYLEVCDTGVGMDEDVRRRCLEPFFTTKGERGTGLGLAMVYGIVRRHNADIEIESAVGKGTTMRLIFPTPAAPTGEPATAMAPYAVPTRLRILVVDDDPLLIKSLRDTLETDGHVITTATGGRDGIDMFKKAQANGGAFAVVITDLGMPYVDGRQVAAAIKSAAPATPVIMLTGWGQRLVAEGDIPPHVDKVLNKPPKLRELREALAQCLPPTQP